MRISRRGFFFGMGAGGVLLAAWALSPRRFAPPLRPGPGEYAFDAWLKIGKDGVVSVAVPQVEMGQGITTLLPQVVAMELGADWRQIAVEPTPVSGAYANAVLAGEWAPLWLPLLSDLADEPDSFLARRFAEGEAFTATADGTSLAAHEAAARAAAAGARAMLAKAAAAKWGVGWEECEAQGGLILNGKNKATFGELVADAAGYSPPNPPVLRAEVPRERPGEFPPGAPLHFPRLDLPSKVDGSHAFAGDIRLPDMAFAAIRHGPIGDCKLGHYDAGAASQQAGLISVVPGDGWLAAVASNWWAAEQALAKIAPRFVSRARPDSETIDRALGDALKRDGDTVSAVGDAMNYLSAKVDFAVDYAIAPALHGGIETASATARIENGHCELWAASQAPQSLRKAVARALDIAVQDVTLYPVPAGGSFDARLEHDHAVEAAVIARAVKRPVQLVWSRWQDHVAGRPRTPAAAHLAAQVAPDGSLVAARIKVAMPAAAREFGGRLFNGRSAFAALDLQDETDSLATAGLTPPYAVPNLLVEHVPVRTRLPTGRMRGNSHGIGAYLFETFIDELAVKVRHEPLSYRMFLLSAQPRLAACLQRAATLAEWGGGSGGSGQGLACWKMALGEAEGYIAVVASARHDERGIKVDELTAVADVGRILNVDIARQQIEGGLLFGLGLANGSTTRYAQGLPQTGRLGLLGLPLLADCPDIVTEFIDSDAPLFDPGELGAVAAPPAIANALASSGSVRSHALPIMGAPM
ncbi:MAG: molybdopterin cofactor-binding domain-containing protein [Novosphingobium sp.]